MKKILLLGSGELGKEFTISAKRLGCEVIACDKYAHAPAMQVADRSVVFDMLDAKKLANLVDEEKPDFIVPEIEAIRTEELLNIEKKGITVVPSARAVNLTMNRDAIRDRAIELGIKTAQYKYAHNLDELDQAIKTVGLPCIVKPVMSSSGKGQTLIKTLEEVPLAWENATKNMRGDRVKVIVEEFINFISEITLLTIRQSNSSTIFCPPIGHQQEQGDYIEREGIRRTRKLLKEADIILNITEDENYLPKSRSKKEWLILNKIDKSKKPKKNLEDKAILVSAKTGEGLEGILEKIHKEITKITKRLNDPKNIILNLRQAKELEEAEHSITKALEEISEEIISEHLRQAVRSLERIIGNIDVEEVLGNIFSNFCIGK